MGSWKRDFRDISETSNLPSFLRLGYKIGWYREIITLDIIIVSPQIIVS